MLEILKPRLKFEEVSEKVGRFYVEPLERGFGHTLGNSLRRVLLSSLPGAALTSVKIEGIVHEFSTIPGVLEDVVDIILNLKGVVFKLHTGEATATIKTKGPKEVKASDIVTPSGLEVVNPEHHIATLGENAKLEMSMRVERGHGYALAERNKRPGDPIGVIPIDSNFSPIRRVTYRVEDTRVGQRTDYNRLILEVETDGSITPQEAVSMGAKVIGEHLNLFFDEEKDMLGDIFTTRIGEKKTFLSTPIEDLELSVRSYNCLKRQKIDTLEQLINYTEEDLLKIRNFGQKSMNEIKEKLASLNLSLKEKKWEKR